MKKITLLILVLSATAFVTRAQTSITNPPPPSFFSSVGSYFTSFDTNYLVTFGSHRLTLAVGVDSLQGNGTVPLANSLRLSYNILQPTTSPTNTTGLILGLEEVTRSSGVAGTIVSQQIGLQAGYVIVDTEVQGYIDGGYNFFDDVNTKEKIFCEFGIRIEKALSLNTFAGIGLGEQIPINRQVGEVFTGFTF